ncbi:efflux RND transporter permease subunit [Teredinibacter haidensis]|uniref:efflux RND transporter permease subunit n=1 Tax=Teredinibacter haidensis TaxID=2731755 RepID=UPI000948F360|nr:efflux RND transporter permease subunit [Teredinibacter haidensis]
MSDSKLNFAGRLAQTFVTSKLTLLLMLTCTLLGVFAVYTTPREENPQISMPAAMVQVMLPGASPAEVEAQIIRPLESIVNQIPGVDHTYATAMNSVGVLMVQFNVGEDKEKSLVKLYDRVLGERNKLPPSAGQPQIHSADADDVPVVTVTLASEKYDDYAMKRIADRMIEGLLSLESVSTTYVRGGRDRELRIELDPQRMQAYGVTFDQIRLLISADNISSPLGSLVQSGSVHNVTFDGFISSANELNHLVVGHYQNRPLYLGDVAQIVDGPDEQRSQVSRFAYGPANAKFGHTEQPEIPAITLAIAKKHGTNAVFFARDVIQRIERMKHQLVPEGIDVVVTRNDGKKADDAVNTLIEHLGIAVLAVFVVTALFLGFKEALIVGITVPMILALTLAAVNFAGLTINRVTLFGLILSLGLLVDAAIVVIENIHRNYTNLNGRSKSWVSVISVNEIGNPTNLATLAVMTVFYSLIPALTGMPKQYFYPIGFTVPVAMAASLLVAYSIVPWAANRWVKAGGHTAGDTPSSSRLSRFYYAAVAPIIDCRKLRNKVLIAVALAMALSLLQPLWQFIRPAGVSGPQSWLGVEMSLLPKDNKNTFNITIDMPESTPLEVTDRLVRNVGEILRTVPEVLNYQSWLGETGVPDFNSMLRGNSNKTGPHVAAIRVNITDKKSRKTSSIVLARELRKQLAALNTNYPGATIQVVEDPPGPPVRATILAEIYSQDLEQLRTVSNNVRQQFRNTYDMVETNSSEVSDVKQYRLTLDREKAALSGITSAQVAVALRRLINGEQLGVAHIEGERNPLPIQLQIPQRYQIDPALLSGITLMNPQGSRIPLSTLVKVHQDIADYPIQHKDGVRVSIVGGELGHTAPAYAVLELNQHLNNMDLANGEQLTTGNLGFEETVPDLTKGKFQLLWGGEIRMTLNAYRDLIAALTMALSAIFLILVAYYRSFLLPVIAMAAIPLGLVGIFPGHWLLHQQFSASSLVGIVALAGIVVRNSLLLIDFVIDYLQKGMPLRQAILQAGAVRLRPILLTALAIIFGSMVMLTDPVFSGLAISLIFGTLSSTVLTLVIVPLLLYLFYSRYPIVEQADSKQEAMS